MGGVEVRCIEDRKRRYGENLVCVSLCVCACVHGL